MTRSTYNPKTSTTSLEYSELMKKFHTYPKTKEFGYNFRGKDFVVGDIHGCFSKVEKRLKEVNFVPEIDRLFCVGDLVDRGTESHRALEWLSYPWFHCVMGNHEWMAIQHADVPAEEHLYDRNGGAWFINLTKHDQLLYVEKFIQLPYAITVRVANGKQIGIVHADCVSDTWEDSPIRLKQYCWQNHATWCRSGLSSDRVIKGIDQVIHGHTPLKYVIKRGNRVYIDTAACFDEGFITLERLDHWL